MYLLHSLRLTLFSSLLVAPPRALMKEGAWTSAIFLATIHTACYSWGFRRLSNATTWVARLRVMFGRHVLLHFAQLLLAPLLVPCSYCLYCSSLASKQTSYFQIINVLQNRCVWMVSILSLCSFPTHVFPVLSVRKRLCILCVPPKFNNLPSNRFVSTTKISMKYVVIWIPLRIRVRSRNTQPHLKVGF